jgi:protein O-GlcNAc transferase
MHDDVWIDDADFGDRIVAGLTQYDVIGVVGNRRRAPYQPAWAFVDPLLNWDGDEHLSGAIGHGQKGFGEITVFGPSPSDCEMLDGVFIAARKEALNKEAILFDPLFDFHFYDVDFARSVRAAGLKVGTWPIALTHQSDGAFGTPNWREKYALYLGKWQK